MVILDSSALIAGIYGEPGADRVDSELPDARIVAVNLEETLNVLLRDGMPLHAAVETVRGLDLDVIDFTEEMAIRSASLRNALPEGLGLGDRACLAAAAVLDISVLAADRGMADGAARVGLRVILIR